MKNIVKRVLLAGILVFGLSACESSGSGSDTQKSEKVQNSSPISNAGSDQEITIGTVFSLNGAASTDIDGDTIAFRWSLIAVPPGSAAALRNETSVSPTFTADIVGSYVAQLVVNDGSKNSAPDTVTIVATKINSVPVASAGTDQNITTGTMVNLNGAASSDADGDTLAYQWSLTSVPASSSSALSNATAISPTFTADVDGVYVAQLVVNDGTKNSAPDTVTIVAAKVNSAPVANAGADQNIATGTMVNLNGAASSDTDGDTLAFQWSLTSVPAGSSSALSNATAISPTFAADVDGVYVAQLVINDGTKNSAPDTVTIVAATANSAPVANAGADQNIATGAMVNLNGIASSDADGDMLAYRWSLTSVPAGSASSLSKATAISPTFIADVDGTYVAQLIINDGSESSVPDTVTIVAATANSAPVASAGANKNVVSTTIVILDGSASSDADGDGLSYTWAFLSKPVESKATLNNSQVVNPNFTADIEGSYLISLVVSDGLVNSISDIVRVEVIKPRIKLFQKSGAFLVGTFNELSLPYTSFNAVNANVVGIPAPTTYLLDTFKLRAEGKNFTIKNLSATDANTHVAPFFTIISNGFTLADGVDVEFELVSPLTRRATANIGFTFEIEETGETFSASYIFTSN